MFRSSEFLMQDEPDLHWALSRRQSKPRCPGGLVRSGQWCWLGMMAGAVLLTGCSDGRLPLAAVTGEVTVGGDPLAAGRIVFQPESGRGAFGRVTNGQIVDVTTYISGDGVPVGRQRIAVQPEIDEGLMMKDPAAYAAMTRQSDIPARYRQASTSDLTAEILPGKENVIEIAIPRQ